jgi:hypothetical protein
LGRGFSFKKIVPIIKNQAVNLHTNHINVSQRASHFLVALLLSFSTKIFSQQQLPRIAQNHSHELKFSSDFQQQYFETTFGYRRTEIIVHLPLFSLISQGGDFCGPHYIAGMNRYPLPQSFFCKKEIQFEDGTSIPLRFRIGSLDYVNRLEGKDKTIQLKE